MKKRKFKDPDRPIETYPGYLGLCHDGSYEFDPVLQPLSSFPWKAYRDLETSSEDSSERNIRFSIGASVFSLTFDRDMIDLFEFLEKLLTVTLASDDYGGDLGPGSGGITTIWENEKFNLNEIQESVTRCLECLTEDFVPLKQHSV
jgi:hypothetical protein